MSVSSAVVQKRVAEPGIHTKEAAMKMPNKECVNDDSREKVEEDIYSSSIHIFKETSCNPAARKVNHPGEYIKSKEAAVEVTKSNYG